MVAPDNAVACEDIPDDSQPEEKINRRELSVGQSELFPKRLQDLRERRRLSRRTLAELCGLSKNMISLYERGEKAPSVDALISLADFFEVSTDYLLGRKNF